MRIIAYEFEYLNAHYPATIKIFDDGEVELWECSNGKSRRFFSYPSAITISYDSEDEFWRDYPDGDSIKNVISKYFIETKDFRNPLIPGVIKTVKTLDSEQILHIIRSIQQEISIWIEDPENPIIFAPWFGTAGIGVLRYNMSKVMPCFVLQDMATHAQAFYRLGTAYDEICWLHHPIVDTDLVKGWYDCGDLIITSLDDFNCAF